MAIRLTALSAALPADATQKQRRALIRAAILDSSDVAMAEARLQMAMAIIGSVDAARRTASAEVPAVPFVLRLAALWIPVNLLFRCVIFQREIPELRNP